MTKKLFFKFSMLLFVLAMSTTAAWAFEGRYYAKLTGTASTTTSGAGKVYVSATTSTAVSNWDSKRHMEDYPMDEQWSAWEEGNSNVEYVGSLASADGIDIVASQFVAYARANDGSYFTGWSFSDGNTDLGSDPTLSIKLTPSKTAATMDPEDEMDDSSNPPTLITKGTLVSYNAREYVLYATFEPLLIEGYSISGSNTTVNKTCTQTVTFRVLGKDVDTNDFNTPTFVKQTGTGTWTVGELACTAYESYGDISVPVTFTADNTNAGEFSTTMRFSSKVGKTMEVVLSARTLVGSGAGNAVLYDGKMQKTSGTVAEMLAVNTSSYTNPILKLSGNYNGAVEINKNLTFDLNGFTLSNSLTVSGGNVTIAYSPFGGSANALNVTSGKAILNGGIFGSLTIGASGTVEQNGATITGAATNNGSLTTTDGKFQGGLTSGKTLVVNGGTFNGDVAINVTSGTAQIKKGSISGTSYGVQSAGTTTIEKLAKISGTTKALKRSNGTLTVNNGKFTDPSDLAEGDIVFNAAYFLYNGSEVSTVFDKQVWRNTAGAEFRDGYSFFAGDQDAAYASNVPVCRIGGTAYSTLEDALSYAANHPADNAVIILENDYTLKAGHYTVPANATLIVPMSNEQETANPEVPRSLDPYSSNRPVSFRKLIFENGVNMEVAGTIELSCAQFYTDDYMGVPGGKYGHLIMKPGSHMTINNGGELRAWGCITGDGTKDAAGNYLSGEIDARRGSIVREMFQMGDWKGGNISFTMIQPTGIPAMTHLFPVYIYFIQNIESPVKYHPGSALLCAASVNVSGSINAYANDIKVVGKKGEAAMFLMDEMADAENTWVRKYYDAKKDQQVYEVNSGAQLGSMVINLGSVPGGIFGGTGTYDLVLDSRKFVLPLTSNFKIHLLTGNMQFTQSTSCLPGMEVEVDKESEISIIPSEDPNTVSGALYFYDADQWSLNNNQSLGYVGNSGKFGAIVPYSATWDLGTNGSKKKPNVRDISSPEKIGDAKLIVHGTFRSASGCSVYTTWSKGTGDTMEDNPFTLNTTTGTGGASVISTNEDAGTFIFDDESPAFDGVHWDDPANFGKLNHMTGFGNSVLVNYDHNVYDSSNPYPIAVETVLGGAARMYGFELCTPAMLKNGDGTFVVTEGSPAGRSYCYMNDHWTSMSVAEEDNCFMKDNYGVFYAKPAEYVAVNATVEGGKVVGNADHTFSDAAGTGRLFILMDDCQWWEVEKKDNLYHCLHKDNDTYYYWDDSNPNPALHGWKEQRFTITWKNYDGTEIKSYTYDPLTGEPSEVKYSVTYGTQAEFLGSNPTRPEDIDYTYNFTGWAPALGKVTSDVTYTATYEKQQRKYTIIFTNEGGTEIERQFLIHNAVPACENVPTRTGFTLQWEPEIAAVTGDATYRATWLEEPPTEYAVTFFDYDGTTELKKGSVAVGEMPLSPVIVDDIPTGSTGKPATNEFTYEFDHWSPALEIVSATSAKSYTAVYREVAKKYTVIFQNEDGSEIERHDYAYGETPVCSATPTKANTAEFTYSFAWTPQIQTVQDAATYRAVFTPTTNRYTVTLRCNVAGACAFTGAGTYDYGTSVTISAVPNDGFEFLRWQETGDENAILDPQTVTEDITLTAVLKKSEVPLPENLEVGIDGSQTIPSATDYNDVIITSDGVAHSGQIINANNITLYGNADYVLQKDMTARLWYCFAVPWRVEAQGGIFIGESTTPAVIGRDFEIIYYDGALRASQAAHSEECWVNLKRTDNAKILEPGRAYMIALYNSASKVVFRKKIQAPILTTTTKVEQYPSFNTIDANWNGIANPALFHAFINAGSAGAQGQYYVSEDDRFDWFDLDDAKLVVGEPVYVQAPEAKTVVANSDSYAPAPRRDRSQYTKFEVQIMPVDATEYSDHICVQLNEDKEENAYVIGEDLCKMGVSSKVAQMWVNRYNTKLCVNTVAPESDETDFPLSIFAPKAGDYTVAIERERNTTGLSLYLTFDGRVISNLQNGAYTLTLQKGTDTRYGLRIYGKAPQVSQDIDAAIIDSQDAVATKVLINNQVFIIRGDKVYTVEGQMVK